MTATHFERVVAEALTAERETDGQLTPDELYGLYTSWCLLHSITPVGDVTFRSAMQRRGIDLRNSRRRMIGPAAADYILSSYPATA